MKETMSGIIYLVLGVCLYFAFAAGLQYSEGYFTALGVKSAINNQK